jgi:3-oxoacyl-[acyl-carrier-protein] synthase II
VPARIAATAVRTCFGDGEQTFAALLDGRCGARPIEHFDPSVLNVPSAYQIERDGLEPAFQASAWLEACVREAIERSGLDLAGSRVMAVVGTGLRELRAVERAAVEPMAFPTEALHFESVVRRVVPTISSVTTISNACSAGGHALALAEDLLELGEADVAIAASTDAMTESMLAMIGRFATTPTTRVRPFDRDRIGVLLGEGAAAAILVADGRGDRRWPRLLGTAMTCDAAHETMPAEEGIWRSMEDALRRADRSADDVDLVVAHGTGTALNDPLEASLLTRLFAASGRPPLVTGIKGAIGHTSGSAALMSVDVALRCLEAGVVPPVVGLSHCIEEGQSLRFVTDRPVRTAARVAQIDAFGFGGVNAVTLVESA